MNSTYLHTLSLHDAFPILSHLGPRELFLYFAIVFAALTVYTLWRLRNSIESPAATTFQAMVRTTPEATHMLEDNAELTTEQRGRTLSRAPIHPLRRHSACKAVGGRLGSVRSWLGTAPWSVPCPTEPPRLLAHPAT